MDHMTTHSSNFRSTFFTMKERSDDADGDSIKTKKVLSKNKNYGSKHNLEKHEEDSMLPKITGTNNFSNVMDSYKKSFYNKKFSNDINFALQGKRAH